MLRRLARITGRTLIGVAALALGYTIGLVLSNRAYLPQFSNLTLIGAATLTILAVLVGGLLSRDRPSAILAGQAVVAATLGLLYLGTVNLNLGGHSRTLPDMLNVDPSTLDISTAYELTPSGTSTVTLRNSADSLKAHLRDNGFVGDTTLTKELQLGKTLTVHVLDTYPTTAVLRVVDAT